MGKKKFPSTRAGVLVLLNQMIDGFTEDKTDFPAPTVTVAALTAHRDAIAAAESAEMTTRLAHDTDVEAVDDAYTDAIDDMKTDIKYAELVAKNDNKKLQRVGWSARAEGTPQQPPSIPLGFEALSQGKVSGHFDWKSPKGGGKPKMYDLVQLDIEGGTAYKVLKSTVDTEIFVDGLPTGTVVLAVVAVNDAGRSEPSSPVTLYF